MSIRIPGRQTVLLLSLWMVVIFATGCQSGGGAPVGSSIEPTVVQVTEAPEDAPLAAQPLPETGADSTPALVSPTLGVETASPAVTSPEPSPQASPSINIVEFSVPSGSRPHDVAPAPDGSVWYTAQGSGELGKLDPATGETHHIPLGPGSAPHGVIVGPDGAPWITDSRLNAIVRVDPETEAVQIFQLPDNVRNANLNTAAFDASGILWFTGQNGYYGRLNPVSGQMDVFEAPRGRGPYGIAALPDGGVFYVSLAGSHLAAVDSASGAASVIEPPTANQGARRVWADSTGKLWISEWNAGQVASYDPAAGEWREWRLPGDRPQPYAVYVDDQDQVWLSDFGANALVRFDPLQETFEVYPLPSAPANVRQLLGRPGEVWGAESGVDRLVVLRTQ
jgi:virginiamycin B lyase